MKELGVLRDPLTSPPPKKKLLSLLQCANNSAV